MLDLACLESIDPSSGELFAGCSSQMPRADSLPAVQVFDKTSPGMSGTVLVGGKDVADFKVLGFLSQYNYFFDDSYYTAAPLAMDLIDKFRSGARGSLSDTTWHMRNGLTYRQFGDEATEANFVNAPAGAGQFLDAGGKGTYGDPGGKGTYGDPGAGYSAEAFLDPDLPCGKETAELLGLGVPAEDILHALLRTPELAPNEVYYRYGLRPGLIWHGQRVLGFMLREKGKEPFPVYANAQALAFLRENPSYEVEPITAEANLLEVLKVKARSAFGKEAVPENGSNIQLQSTDKNGGVLNLNFTSEGAKIHLQTPARRSSKDFVDEVSFELDQNGRLQGSAFFTPIVETKGSQSRNRYFADLRNLFFVDIASVAQPLDSPNGAQADFTAALDRQKKSVSVDVRDDMTEMEQTYSLSPR